VNNNLSILIDQRAEKDIDEAVQWYSQDRLELALEFLDAVDIVFKRMSQFPQSYPEVDRGIRIALTKKFPFCVYYAVDDEFVTVFAVLHIRRSPDTWRQRLE
jgi:plasmid stabilization system protein ParE